MLILYLFRKGILIRYFYVVFQNFYLDIIRVNNVKNKVAKKLYEIWQKSYLIEKKILNTKKFPPLERNLEDFKISKNHFYAILTKDDFLGVIEIDHNTNSTHVQSLVVDPIYFRKGIASKLLNKIFEIYKSSTYTVETGFNNNPAKQLYIKMGFKKIQVWNTYYGVKKIRMQKTIKFNN